MMLDKIIGGHPRHIFLKLPISKRSLSSPFHSGWQLELPEDISRFHGFSRFRKPLTRAVRILPALAPYQGRVTDAPVTEAPIRRREMEERLRYFPPRHLD